MPKHTFYHFVAFTCGLVATTAAAIAAEPEEKPSSPASSGAEAKADQYGDPLPPGAVSRLGTVRYRRQDSIQQVAFTPQGELLAVTPAGELCYYEAATGKLLRKVQASARNSNAAALSQNRRWLALSGFRFHEEQRAFSYRLGVFDTETGKPRMQIEEAERLGDNLAISGDGSTVAMLAGDGKLRVWDVEGGIEVLTHQVDRGWNIRVMKFSPDSDTLALGGRNLVVLWRWTSGEEPRVIRLADERERRHAISMDFSPDSSVLAVGVDGRGGVALIATREGRIQKDLSNEAGERNYARDVAFSPDGALLAVTRDRSQGGGVVLWSLATAQPWKTLETSFGGVTNLAFSLDGASLAGVSSWDGTLDLWNVKTGERMTGERPSHEAAPAILHFLDDGGRLVTAGDDGTIRFWETRTGRQTRVLRPGEGEESGTRWIRACAVSPDGEHLVSSSLDDTVRLFRASTGEEIYRWPGHGALGGHRAVAFSPDGGRVASWGDDLRVYIWDVKTGKALEEYRLAPSGIDLNSEEPAADPFGSRMSFRLGKSAFSPGASQFVLNLGTIHLFETRTGEEMRKFQPEAGHLVDLAISPDNRLLLTSRWSRGVQTRLASGGTRVSAAQNHVIALRRLDDDTVVQEINLPEGGAGPVAFSPDGQWFATAAGHEGAIRIFQTSTGKETYRIAEYDSRPRALAFSRGKKLLATSHQNGSVLVWDLAAAGPPSKP
ncbi:MAG: WD40 repeat domain-containing protein [Planctomycetes bacterium]|nr:WD40 repeat domain-containing protein [Planctomycetota bacterium]